jgi:HK97 family phage major capsid protein
MSSRALRLAREVKEMFAAADAENRPLSADERRYAEGLLAEAEQVGEMEKSLDRIGHALGAPALNPFTNPGQAALSPGERFTSSPGFKSIADPSTRTQQFTTGLVPISDGVSLQTKGTFLETPGGGGGALIPVPQVVPGIVERLFQPLTLEALLSSGLAENNSIRYVSEGTTTSGASGVPEGGVKPESTLGLSTLDEPVKKIATFLPVSDELLEDAGAVQSFINMRLSLFVQIETERQLLRGTAGGNEVQGIFNRGIPVYAGGTAAGNYAEQLFKAMNGVRGSAFAEPEWVVMHPTDWQTLRLLKDTTGQFFGGGPFLGSYGNAGQVSSSGQLTGMNDTVWGKPVYVTSSIGGPGTALIGNSQAAQVWSRGGLSVEATNSHSNFFQINLVAIRAERRLGLTMYRSNAFCSVLLS